MHQNKQEDAIRSLEKALFLSQSGRNRQHLKNVYNLLIKAHKLTGNFQKEKDLLEEYVKFTESFNQSLNKSLEKTLIIKDNEKKRDQKNTFILISIFTAILTISIFVFFLKRRNKTNKIINEKEAELRKLDNNIKLLDKKKHNYIEELCELAKSRNSNFYANFLEHKPDFIKRLLVINPKLQNRELELLAYIYLNFQTKEIADLLYLTPKTIQNKKHSVRKKLNIKPTDDLYIWLKSQD